MAVLSLMYLKTTKQADCGGTYEQSQDSGGREGGLSSATMWIQGQLGI